MEYNLQKHDGHRHEQICQPEPARIRAHGIQEKRRWGSEHHCFLQPSSFGNNLHNRLP